MSGREFSSKSKFSIVCRKLKKCTHSGIAQEILSQIFKHSIWGGEPVVVLDAPLLFESKASLLCKVAPQSHASTCRSCLASQARQLRHPQLTSRGHRCSTPSWCTARRRRRWRGCRRATSSPPSRPGRFCDACPAHLSCLHATPSARSSCTHQLHGAISVFLAHD